MSCPIQSFTKNFSSGGQAMQVTIYHNPRCSKSRETLALLRDNQIEPVVIDYLKNPPDAAALKKLLKALRLKPRELLRTKEEEYTALGLDDPALSDEALVAAMIAHPILIERPIVEMGSKAVLDRPPEKEHKLKRRSRYSEHTNRPKRPKDERPIRKGFLRRSAPPHGSCERA